MKVALWARVSTTEQETLNQLFILREWAAKRGDEVVREFVTEDSAWSQGNGPKGKEFDKARADLQAGAHHADYQAVLIWALDRLSRRGYRDLEGCMSQLAGAGCEVLSHEEPFIRALGPWGEIVIHMLALVAQQSSDRNSRRIKAGLDRRKRDLAAGKQVPGRQSVGGRKPGSKDRKPRAKVTGEAKGWTPERKDRLIARNKARAAPKAGDAP